MTQQTTDQSKKKTRLALVVVILLAGFCICSLVVGLGAYFILGERGQRVLPFESRAGLSIDERTGSGVTTGVYRYLNVLGGHQMKFEVSENGVATFEMEGSAEDQVLTVDLQDKATASLTWGGVAIDGEGALTAREQEALADLMGSDMVHGLKYIPLDAACQGEAVVTAKQLAALLVPLQMRFKYMITDRSAEAKQLMEFSRCAFGTQTNEDPINPSMIQLTPSQPVPVVIGYFPFDGEGALESSALFGQGAKNACQPVLPLSTAGDQQQSLSGDSVTQDEFGPCEAMCRGACGADCEPNNCRMTKELRCELDEQGRNTGNEVLITSYDCGLHEGCIEHDACYDRCNDRYGCDSWGAAFCRHGWSSPVFTTSVFDLFCDEGAILSYGTQDPILWMNGFGPMSEREIFEYTDQDYGRQANLDRCPVTKLEDESEKQPQDERPEVTFEWVLADTAVNPAQAREVYAGGGSTPGWFSEERFKGKSLTYTVSDSSFTIHDIDVDHEYKYRDVTLQVDFEAPPAVLEPGTSKDLKVSFSSSGAVYEGGSGIFAQFWYSSDDVAIRPVDFFSYAPWADGFNGVSSTEYVLDVPPSSTAEEFSLYATLMNAEPCLVTWTYRLQEKP